MKVGITRVICLLLVLLFVMPSLVACPDKDKDKNNVTEVTGTGEDRFKDTDFGGATVKLCLPGSNSGSDGAKYMSGLDEKTALPIEGDTITTTIKERNDYVMGKLNLKVDYTYLDSNWETVYQDLMTKFEAHDGFADAAAIQISGMVKCMMAGIFTNANTDQYTNYFELTEAGWYADSMKAFSLGEDIASGKQFLLAGDYFLDIIRCADVMFVNETVFANKVGVSVDDLYYNITAGFWTYDKLGDWAKLGYSNSNGNNDTDVDDELGLIYVEEAKNSAVGAGMSMAIVYSSGIIFMTENGGAYEYNDISNAFTKLIDKTKAVFNLTASLPVSAADENAAAIDTFAKGKSMFVMGLRLMDLENSKIDSIEKCPIPYPKLNQTDSYSSVVHNLASVGGIFKGAKFTEVSAFWQYATIKSEATRLKYYEDGLKLKYETGSDTSEVLDLIYNSITTSMAYTWDAYIKDVPAYNDAKAFYSLYMHSIRTDTFSSNWASCRDIKRSGLAYSQAEFDKLS